MKKVIQVSGDLASYIESLSYTVSSLRELLMEALERGLQDSPAFERWEQKYMEAGSELCVAKGQLEREFVLPVSEGKTVNWKLDYESCEVTIEEVSE